MAMPKSITKVTKDGLEFTINVDATLYTLQELKRAALRDVAKLIRKRLIEKQKQFPGMKRSRRIYRSTQYWVRKRDADLQVGMKHDSWYGAKSELGTHGQPARGILRDTVYENIDEIQRIQAQYLSGISDKNPSLAGTDEGDYISPDGEE